MHEAEIEVAIVWLLNGDWVGEDVLKFDDDADFQDWVNYCMEEMAFYADPAHNDDRGYNVIRLMCDSNEKYSITIEANE